MFPFEKNVGTQKEIVNINNKINKAIPSERDKAEGDIHNSLKSRM